MQNSKKAENSIGTIIAIALKLLVICAFIATLVASVNFLTKDRIALNQKTAAAEALSDIYSADGLFFSVDQTGAFAVSDTQGNPVGSCEKAETELMKDIDAVYVIKKTNGKVFGYCVEASPMGFKNEVGVLVAVNSDASAKDVQIISLSDTKGIGDKVMLPEFLEKFAGKKSGFSKSESYMKDIIIAGATRTSKPVTVAVDTALEQIKTMIDGGAENE